MSLRDTFKRSGRDQLSGDELKDAGWPPARIKRAVQEGRLREGICGYWLPKAADPGAVAVMRAALNDSDDQ